MHECMRAKSLSHIWVFAILWSVACQPPLSMGFSGQEYQSVLSCPPPGGLPDLGIEDTLYLLPLQAGSLLLVSPGKPSRDDGSLKYFKHHLGHEYMVVSVDYCSLVALKTWGHLCISHVCLEEENALCVNYREEMNNTLLLKNNQLHLNKSFISVC